MSVPHLGILLRRLRWLIDQPERPPPSDGDLVARFVAERDEAAFELLVWRHGPGVFRLCRRMLRIEQDAEDAFQATFLTLARQATSIGKRQSLASWLFKVAYRIILRVQQRRRRCEVASLDGRPEPVATAEYQAPDADVRLALDEELRRLPDKYRSAVILCYLEGKTNTEAAAELGCPRGTIDSRLTWARQRLRQRLARRGVSLSITAALGLLARSVTAGPLPAALARATAHLGVQFAGGAAGLGSVPSILLARGVLRAMFLTKLKTVFAAVAATAIIAAASWGLVRTPTAEAQGPTAEAQVVPPAVQQPAPPRPLTAASEPAEVEKTLKVHERPVLCVAFSPDGWLLASGGEGAAEKTGELCIWEAPTGKLRAMVRTEAPVRSLAFSPNSRILALAAGDTVNLLDATTGKLTLTVKQSGTVQAVRFAPDGKLLATVSRDKTIRLWDTAGNEVRAIDAADEKDSLAFSPDGRLLAAAGSGTGVSMWDVRTGRAILTLHGQARAVVFAPEGKTLATAGADKTVRLWDAATGKEIRTLKGHTHPVSDVAFALDGSLLASCSGLGVGGVPDEHGPGEIILWDPATGKQVAILRGHKAPISSVSLSPHGARLASASWDGTVKLWRVGRGAGAAGIVPDRLDQLVDQLLASKRSDEQVLEGLYLATLGRLPTEGEQRRFADLKAGGDRQARFAEVRGALLASRECREHQETLRQRSGQGGRP
jgi:RNA polymerase sigma factor (sigma-70 family)